MTFELDTHWDTRTHQKQYWDEQFEWRNEKCEEREENKPKQAERWRDFFVSAFILSIGSMCYHVWMLYISAWMEQIHNGMEIFLFDCCTLTIDIIFFTQDLSYFLCLFLVVNGMLRMWWINQSMDERISREEKNSVSILPARSSIHIAIHIRCALNQ